MSGRLCLRLFKLIVVWNEAALKIPKAKPKPTIGNSVSLRFARKEILNANLCLWQYFLYGRVPKSQDISSGTKGQWLSLSYITFRPFITFLCQGDYTFIQARRSLGGVFFIISRFSLNINIMELVEIMWIKYIIRQIL